jgi:tRNA modification GTPase
VSAAVPAAVPAAVSMAALDAAAQAAARRAIAEADVLIQLDDSAPPASPRTVALRVKAKADLQPCEDGGAAALRVSAVTGRGLDELRARLADALFVHAGNLDADTLVLQPRHEQTLRDALTGLDEAIALLPRTDEQPAHPRPELVAASMRGALDALGALAGRMTPDDVLGRVFASFCIGK